MSNDVLQICMYSGTSLIRTLWDLDFSPYYRGVLNSEVIWYITVLHWDTEWRPYYRGFCYSEVPLYICELAICSCGTCVCTYVYTHPVYHTYVHTSLHQGTGPHTHCTYTTNSHMELAKWVHVHMQLMREEYPVPLQSSLIHLLTLITSADHNVIRNRSQNEAVL